MKNKKKEIKMLLNGEWVDWDGRDVDKLLIKETITLKEFKKHYPDKYQEYINNGKKS